MSPAFSLSEVFLRNQSDARLCALATGGEALPFAVLVERHGAALTRTAATIAGSQQAEDVVQEALLRAWGALCAGTEVEQARGWFHQIVRNTAINHIARERMAAEPLPDDLADSRRVEAVLDGRRTAHDLLAQIATLPERQRTALVETELAGRSRQEIATELGVSEGAVRQLVHRARCAVRLALTAITPYPLAAWIARRGARAGSLDRFAGILPPPGSGRRGLLETVTGGSVAGGGLILKGTAVIVAVGALGSGVAWRVLPGARAPDRVAHQLNAAPTGAAVRTSRAAVNSPIDADPVWNPGGSSATRGTVDDRGGRSRRPAATMRSRYPAPAVKTTTVKLANADGTGDAAPAPSSDQQSGGGEADAPPAVPTGTNRTSDPSDQSATTSSDQSGDTTGASSIAGPSVSSTSGDPGAPSDASDGSSTGTSGGQSSDGPALASPASTGDN